MLFTPAIDHSRPVTEIAAVKAEAKHPDEVAEGILKLHDTGFAGTTLSFVDYVKQLPYFRDNVLPKLQEAGIR